MVSEAMSDERWAEINQLTASVFAGGIHPHFDEATAWLAILDLRREVERQRAAPTQSYYQLLEQRLSDKGDEVERLRAAQAELAKKLDAETDYSAGRIESLLERCAGLRHRAHVAEQQRDAAMAVARAVADGEVYHDSKGGMLMVAAPDALLAKARALLKELSEAEGKSQS